MQGKLTCHFVFVFFSLNVCGNSASFALEKYNEDDDDIDPNL